MRLSNKVAIITGAGRGIGQAAALRFAREGAKVAVCDRDPAGVADTVALIQEQGGEAAGLEVDVTDKASVERMVDSDRLYVGQDGGASLSYDHGKTWVFYDNISAAQFYAVSADMRDPYYVYGGLQDNGTWGGPSMHREGQILTDFWYNIAGGDGFHTQNDPQDWRTVYGESQGGAAQRFNVETREAKQIRPTTMNILNYREWYPPAPPDKKTPAAKPGAKPEAKAPAAKPEAKSAPEEAMRAQMQAQRGPFRFNWSAPIVLSPHNPGTL